MKTSPRFEELDFRRTPLGDLILRRRTLATLGHLQVYEIILGDAFLMSSLFTTVEKALAELGLAAALAAFPADPPELDVLVGGLGLGYTAQAALANPHVGSLLVIDSLEAVIEWHHSGLVPLGAELTQDPRCRFMHGDFFRKALLKDSPEGFDPAHPGRTFHAVLLDIDHSPSKLLHGDHAEFYRPDGLRRLTRHLRPGGVFALWSDDPPDAEFLAELGEVFETCESQIVSFENPLLGKPSSSTVYVARVGGRPLSTAE